mmetsp:Transcript_26638/g.53084  ORF Transcript_26638/g.53084 Transcript_26638/m.53084 type:complete len:120 (-) Transcript_26638:58-417(-)
MPDPTSIPPHELTYPSGCQSACEPAGGDGGTGPPLGKYGNFEGPRSCGLEGQTKQTLSVSAHRPDAPPAPESLPKFFTMHVVDQTSTALRAPDVSVRKPIPAADSQRRRSAGAVEDTLS